MQTGDGESVFPVWQFTAGRDVIPYLADVLEALSAGSRDRWMWALWLTAANPDWGGSAAWQRLAAGHAAQPVLDEARADAARWAS